MLRMISNCTGKPLEVLERFEQTLKGHNIGTMLFLLFLVVSAYPGRPMPFIKIFVGINIHTKYTCSHAPHDIKLHWKTWKCSRDLNKP